MLSGLAMVLIGVWLTLQGVGGNLAGRIRDWAQGERRFSGFGGGGGFGSPGSSAGGSSWGSGSGSAGGAGAGGGALRM